METMSIKEFAAQQGFSSIHPIVRANSNGYPYITFLTAGNEAENVYFSKEAAKLVAKDMPVTKGMLGKLQAAQVENAQGEKRWKLISNSGRVDLADLLD